MKIGLFKYALRLPMSVLNTFFTRLHENKNNNKSIDEIIKSDFSSVTTTNPVDESNYHVAIQGCCHGELHKVYETCAEHERSTGKKIKLLLCCGDFQSMRSVNDLSSMSAPEKFLKLGDFKDYWSPDPEKVPAKCIAPYLTIFVGGNHENSDWLAEESYGGFLAPNIYYLGHSGVILVDGCICIAGLSGIYKGMDYRSPYPCRPYKVSKANKVSAYHIRQIEVEKLNMFANTVMKKGELCTKDGTLKSCLTDDEESDEGNENIHFFLSHDWPAGITAYGNEEQLLRYKPFFKDDISHGALGNRHTLSMLKAVMPEYWVAAHLHCFFTAKVNHPVGDSHDAIKKFGTVTKFIALDKCSKASGFLDYVDVQPYQYKQSSNTGLNNTKSVSSGYDRIRRHPKWLRILVKTHSRLAANDCKEITGAANQTPSLGVKMEDFCRAEFTPTTASLLQTLGLTPAHPLQTLFENSSSFFVSSSTSPNSKEKDHQFTLPLLEKQQIIGSSDEGVPWMEDLNPS